MRACRPDLDLAAPGLRGAWEEGDTERYLVEPVEGSAICHAEGNDIGVRR